MSDWTILAFSTVTTLLLGLGLGYTFLEFYRADKRLKEEGIRSRARMGHL